MIETKIEPIKILPEDYKAFRLANGFHGNEKEVREFLRRKVEWSAEKRAYGRA